VPAKTGLGFVTVFLKSMIVIWILLNNTSANQVKVMRGQTFYGETGICCSDVDA